MEDEEPWRLEVFLVIALIGHLGLSASVFLAGAEQEPYFVFDASEALVQVGLGCSLLALVPVWIGLLAWGVRRRLVSPAWWLAVIPLLICCFYLSFSPFGYVSDLDGARKPLPGGGVAH